MKSNRRFFVDLDESMLPLRYNQEPAAAVPAVSGEETAVMFFSSSSGARVEKRREPRPRAQPQSLVTAAGAQLVLQQLKGSGGTPLGIGRNSLVVRGSLSGQPVAVKIPNGDEESLEAARQEAKLLAQLGQHCRRILPLLDTVPEGDLNILPLGVPLNQLHVTRPTLWKWSAQLAAGLAELHAAGFIHHDIKPHNLLIVEGNLFIADLGQCLQPAACATPLSDLSHLALGSDHALHAESKPTLPAPLGRGRGTAAYTAPELLLGDDQVYSNAIDIYSFGVTLYSLLLDREPWRDCSPVKLLISIRRGFLDDRYNPTPTGPVRLSSGESLSEADTAWFIFLIARCTDLDPEQRPTAAELEQLFNNKP